MSHFMLQFFSTFLVVGGLGFLNFRVADRLGTMELKSYSMSLVVGYSLLWSIVDYIAYLFIYKFCNQFDLNQEIVVLLSMLLTIIFAFFFTLLVAPLLSRFVRKLYSYRLSSGATESNMYFGYIIQKMLNDSDNERVYIYDFNHRLIQYGYLNGKSVTSQGVPLLELSLPDPYDKKAVRYDSVMKLASSSDSRSFQYVDPLNKFIIVIFETN